MEFGVLGPLEVRDGDVSIPLAGAKQRGLLAFLLVRANHVVSRDRLIDGLWGDEPPETAVESVQVYVSRLRKLLPPKTLLTRPPGYLLEIEPDTLDLYRFERLFAEGREVLAGGEVERASALLRQALELWRGPALAEFGSEPFAQAEIGRLEDLRVSAVEERVDADLALGRHPDLIGELQATVAEHPHRERLRSQLMLALYRCGRQADALAAYQDARLDLVEVLGIEPGAELKQLERRILAQDATLLASPRTLDHINLPVPATAFLGRDHELSELTGLLAGSVRLLTLTGPGGSGKTRLALQAAAAVSEQFPDGVWWVPLASLRDPALVLVEVARVLDIDQSGRELAEVLGEVLAGKRLLLLLDNAEHLLPDAAAAVALLRDAGGPRLLVTSRERLQLAGEQVYPVAPLSKPDGLALFIARACAVSPGFEADAAVDELCDRLDNLPLALELAAANVTVLTPAQIVQRLEKRLSLVTRGPRDVPEHQRTLRATIDWSYQLLSDHERRLFRRLAVFTGGCGLEAAETVAGADIGTLHSLIEKSLIRHSGERYWSLATIGEYMLERLEESSEELELRQRHGAYFVALVGEDASGMEARAAIDVLRAELDNLRATLAWLASSGAQELQLRLALSLYDLWITGGYAGEGRKALQDALAASDQHPPDLRASALKAAGDLALEQGDFGAANEFLGQALSLYRELRRERGVASCLTDLGHVAKCERDYVRAAGFFEESIQFARELDEQLVLAEALLNYGDCLVARGDFPHAEALCLESLALYEEHGDTFGVGACRFSLGLACLHQGRQQEALELLTKSLEVMHEFGYAVGIACSLEGLAAIASVRRRGAKAGRLLGAAEFLFEKVGASLEPAEQALHEQTVAALRAQLGEARLADVWTEGRSMSLEDAVELALREMD